MTLYCASKFTVQVSMINYSRLLSSCPVHLLGVIILQPPSTCMSSVCCCMMWLWLYCSVVAELLLVKGSIVCLSVCEI